MTWVKKSLTIVRTVMTCRTPKMGWAVGGVFVNGREERWLEVKMTLLIFSIRTNVSTYGSEIPSVSFFSKESLLR